MYNRFLFVGLGGSGGKTLRFLKDQMRRWMKDMGIDRDIPSGWQFLHIDVPPQPDGNELNSRVPHLAGDEYVGLVNAGIAFDDVQAGLDAAADLRSELRVWRVEPTGLKIPIEAGAGQYRAVGRTIGALHIDRIKNRIEEKIHRLNAGQAIRDLDYAYSKAQENGTVQMSTGEVPVNIFVISSLAGGTGAGLLNTVCDLIRGMGVARGRELFGIIYTSEVFNILPAATKAGVHGNGLAAVCELLKGFWWGGNSGTDDDVVVKPITDKFLQAARVTGDLNYSGPAYPFLVGLQNAEGVNFGSADALFEGIGRALFSWVTNEEVAGSFISYTIANFKNSASGNIRGRALVDVGEGSANGLPPFSALGFARVSLGTDHFERFAVDRVMRRCYQHLINYHSRSDEAERARKSLGKSDPNAVIGQLAENYGGWFRDELKVEDIEFETGPIRSELWPTSGSNDTSGSIDRYEGPCRQYQQQVELDASLDVSGNRTASEWRELIDRAVDNCYEAFEKSIRDELDVHSKEWVTAIEKRVTATVMEAISRYGLLVAARLCSDTANVLRNTVYPNLTVNVVPEYKSWASVWQESDSSQRLDSAKGKLKNTDERIGEYVMSAIDYRTYAADALIAERAAEMAREAASRLLDPIAEAIENAHKRLRNDDFPALTQFGPPGNEFSLIEKDNYESEFDRLLTLTFGSKDYVNLRESVLSRADITSGSDARLLEVNRSWAPDARWSGSPAHIDVEVVSTRNTLEQRATAWLNADGGPFGEVFGLSLRSALNTNADSGTAVTAADRLEYQRKFMACLTAAIKTSAPLVDINPALAGLVGTKSGEDLERHFSKLPFGQDPDGTHPMQSEVKALLAPIIGPESVDKLMKPDHRTRHIDVASQLPAPQSILSLSSVLAPIAQDWDGQKSIGEVARQQFWQHRRAQYLQRFVPCPQAHLRCMVRGWFTAQMLGLLDLEGPNDSIRIFRDGKSPVTFPNPLLSPTKSGDRLGPVLESLGLAYVETSASGNLEPLEAYVRLRELGVSGDGGVLHYESVNERLAGWIESGRKVEGALTGMKPARLADMADTATWKERAKAVVEVLDKEYEHYKADYAELKYKWDKNPGLLSRAPLWTGLWPLLGEELKRLSDVVQRHSPDDRLG